MDLDIKNLFWNQHVRAVRQKMNINSTLVYINFKKKHNEMVQNQLLNGKQASTTSGQTNIATTELNDPKYIWTTNIPTSSEKL